MNKRRPEEQSDNVIGSKMDTLVLVSSTICNPQFGQRQQMTLELNLMQCACPSGEAQSKGKVICKTNSGDFHQPKPNQIVGECIMKRNAHKKKREGSQILLDLTDYQVTLIIYIYYIYFPERVCCILQLPGILSTKNKTQN